MGSGEEGLDLGGVQRDFLQNAIYALLHLDYGLSEPLPGTALFTLRSPSSGFAPDLRAAELLGVLVALALHNGVLIDVPLFRAFFHSCCAGPLAVSSEDLRHFPEMEEAYPEMAVQLRQLLIMAQANPFSADTSDAVAEMDFRFEVTERAMDGRPVNIELMAGGSDVLVTRENAGQFVARYVKYWLFDRISAGASAFRRGFRTIYDASDDKQPALLPVLCAPADFAVVLGGSDEVLDVAALEAACTYEGFTRENPTIVWLWQEVGALDAGAQQALVHFVTGSKRIPLRALGALSITVQRSGPDTSAEEPPRLPTAMTCFSRLLLPEYTSRVRLSKALSRALAHGFGFGLT